MRYDTLVAELTNIVVRAIEAFLRYVSEKRSREINDTYETISTDPGIAHVAHRIVSDRFCILIVDPRSFLPGRYLLCGTGGLLVGITAEDSMHDNFSGLLDGKELVLDGVLTTEVRCSDAFITKVVIRAVEALVSNADYLLLAHITDDVLVHAARSRWLRAVRAAGCAVPLGIVAAVVRPDPVVLRVFRRN